MCHKSGNCLHDHISTIEYNAENKSFISHVPWLNMMVVVPCMAMPVAVIMIVAMPVTVH